jgi:polysaccharide export outer membrane protein
MKNDTLKDSILLGIVTVLSACAAGRPSYDVSDISDLEGDVQSTDYEIGPGDMLEIFVWDHVDLSTKVQVRPDGKISTPLVEDLFAAGSTPTQLAREIEEILKEYVRSPVVTVIMQEFVGESSQQIRVVGQAATPMALQYKQGMTILDVMIQVGGLSEFAAGNKSKVVRRTTDGEVEIRVRLDDLLNNGDIKQNIEMKPGDVLVIPQSLF